MSSHITIKRKRQIIKSTIAVAKLVGINNLTREAIAINAKCCPSLINYYFGSMDKLLERAAFEGIEINDVHFMRQLYSINHPAINGWDLK